MILLEKDVVCQMPLNDFQQLSIMRVLKFESIVWGMMNIIQHKNFPIYCLFNSLEVPI